MGEGNVIFVMLYYISFLISLLVGILTFPFKLLASMYIVGSSPLIIVTKQVGN